ncbi:MAG: thiamine phosphate synthase, partial [Bacteroidota bacterium]
MKLIVVSWPGVIRRESKIIEQLFKQGLDFYHLRKPQASVQYVRTVLSSLPENLLSRVVLHDHPFL